MSPNPALLTWPRPVGGGALTCSYVGATGSSANQQTYTFANVPIGTAAADRTVVVLAMTRASGARTVSSLTIGGTAATIDLNAANLVGSPNYETVAVTRLAVPSGDTANIVVTWSGVTLRCSIFVYTITGGAVAVADTGQGGAASGVVSTVVTGTAGGCIIAGGTGTDAHTWAGVTQDERTGFELWCAGASAATTGGDVTVSLTTTFNHGIGVVAYEPA